MKFMAIVIGYLRIYLYINIEKWFLAIGTTVSIVSPRAFQFSRLCESQLSEVESNLCSPPPHLLIGRYILTASQLHSSICSTSLVPPPLIQTTC